MNDLLTIRDTVSTATTRTLTTTVQSVKTTQAKFYGYKIENPNTGVAWVQVFYRPNTEVILGTTAPDFTIKVGDNGNAAWDFNWPIDAPLGLSIAATTEETGSTAPTSNLSAVIFFR